MADIEQFAKLCRDEATELSRLVAFLEQEQRALLTGEALSLDALAEEKRQVLEALASASRVRQLWLQALDITDRESLLVWLRDKPMLCDLWFHLESVLARAMTLNEFNGQQIHQGLHRTQEALEVLKLASASMMSYGPDGEQAKEQRRGRHLGLA